MLCNEINRNTKSMMNEMKEISLRTLNNIINTVYVTGDRLLFFKGVPFRRESDPPVFSVFIPFGPFDEIGNIDGKQEREKKSLEPSSPRCSKRETSKRSRSEMPEMRWGGARIPGQKE